MSMMPQFSQIVFSGGGIRCFWHGGFLTTVERKHTLSPDHVSGVSGGALSAAAWIGDREHTLRELMIEAFRINDANFDRDRNNMTPHQEIYRAVVTTTLDAEAIERIANGPDLKISLSLPTQRVPARLAAVLYGTLYKLDQAFRGTPHLELPKRSGLQQVVADGREAARNGSLIDLICAAATIPPVFDIPRWQGKRVLDGGMFDKAPVLGPDNVETLVLLTKPYRNLPEIGCRTYVQPSCEVPADKIDFSDPKKVIDTWDQGKRDAMDWLSQYNNGS